MPSYQFEGACYDSPSSIAALVAARENGKVYSTSGGVFVVTTSPSADGLGVVYTTTQARAGAVGTVYTQPLQLQPCQMLDWSDGLALGWAVAAVWITVAVVLHLREAAHS